MPCEAALQPSAVMRQSVAMVTATSWSRQEECPGTIDAPAMFFGAVAEL